MLMDLIDSIIGRVSRKWLVGRRFVLDLSEATERRVAVVELPTGYFSFDLEVHDGATRLVLQQEGSARVLGTFSDPLAAQRCARRIRWAIVRPLRRVVLVFVAIFFIIFTFDLATSSRAARMPPPRAASAPTLSPEQISAMRQASQGSQPTAVAAPAAPIVLLPGTAAGEASSPEAQAAIKMLKGR